jgi:branched-subunit amino acid aminotransferase/4-amino-4-deoxychorismate lyase
VFWWEDGKVAAPALELGVLPGVARARIAEIVGSIVERKALVDEVKGQPMFVANAARGVVPVATLDGVAVTELPETEALAARFWP